jgi:competence protein CoiA
MRFALSNNERIEPTKGAKGVCPCCGSELVARCGEIKVHHWAHKKKCDDHWWENETEWHRNWKNQFPKEWQEIIQRDESGEKHIADVKTSSGWTIEFQHSPISKEERDSRDYFYTKLIWVVDGTRRKTDFEQFEKQISSASHISNEPDIVREIVDEPGIGLVFKVACQYSNLYNEPFILRVFDEEGLDRFRLNQEWGSSKSLVLFDFGKSEVNYRDEYKSNEDLWLIHPSRNRTYITNISKDSFIKMLTSSRSDEVYKALLNPVQTKLTEEAKQEQEKLHTLPKNISQKIGYIIGILKNRKKQEKWFDRFDEFDIKVVSKILNNYVENYIRQGYSDMKIEWRLDQVKTHAITSYEWTAWKDRYYNFWE